LVNSFLIQALDGQLNEKTFLTSTLDYRVKDLETSSISLNKDVQFKFARNDTALNKVENDQTNHNSSLKDIQNQIYDMSRNFFSRIHDVENRVSFL
jgi:hypothetical protein